MSWKLPASGVPASTENRCRKRHRRLAGWILIALTLTACATSGPERFTPPPLDFSDRDPIVFALRSIDLRSAYRPSGAPPFVEHTFVITPEVAARRLLEQRLEASGSAGTLRAVILDASVRRIDLTTREGIEGLITREFVARLDGRIKVRIDRVDDLGEVRSSTTTTVSRSTSIPEDADLRREQEIEYDLVLNMVDDLDTGLVTGVRESFAEFVSQ